MEHVPGTFFILYDFIEHFKKDNPSFLQRSAFLDMIDTIFGSQWPVSQLEKDAIIFQVRDDTVCMIMIMIIPGLLSTYCLNIH